MDVNGVDCKRLLRESKKLILSSDSVDIAKGLKLLKHIIKNDPENLWAFIYYGVGASKSVKHRHSAVSAFETASQISPDSVECWKGIRACLEDNCTSEDEKKLLVAAYCNLLRLECDPEKWNTLFIDFKTCSLKISLAAATAVLSSQIGDYCCKLYKHEIACKELSLLVLSNETLLETNMEDALNAFIAWANFLDFSDRPEFCKKICAVLCKLKYMSALSDFLCHTLMVYGPELYLKYQLLQYFVDIAFDRFDNAEKLISLIKKPLEELEHVATFKSSSQVKLALSIVNFFEEDFTATRENLENLSYMGDVNATLFLLKFLCKVKDYESVMFLCVRFARTFNLTSSDKLKYEFILCLLEAISCSNEVSFLDWAIKIGLKALSKYGEDSSLFYHLCHSYAGKKDLKAVMFLENLLVRNSNKSAYLKSLLACRVSASSLDSQEWISLALLSANYDLIDNNVKRSLKGFTKVGVKDKFISDPFLILGVDSLAKGDINKAVSCFHRAFSLRPLNENILKHYLDSLFKIEDEQRALNTLESVWNGHFGKWHLIGEKALFFSGLIHSAKYDHEKSIRSFKHLIKLNPDCIEFVEAISDEYIHLGRLGIAENYVSRLVCDNPYDIHPLLSLTEIYKLDVNYSGYFNQAVKCINFSADETKESERVAKLILCFFINFLKHNNKIEQSSLEYMSKQCESAFYKIEHIVAKGLLERDCNNEFVNVIYVYVESHFLAAVKLMSIKEKFSEVVDLFNFCINMIGRVVELYGSGYTCFWKLLGDILLKSSSLKCNLLVCPWLLDSGGHCGDHLVQVSGADRVHLSLKCYLVALRIVSSHSLSRQHEFYYDISIALIHMANHPEIDNPEYRYFCLIAALESCLKSFVHSDGVTEGRWVHSNLLGVIVSLLGVRDNMFKEHYSSRELKMSEGLMLQNYATHLAKTGLLNHAEETFEQARLRVDMDYVSSWTGQLLMQLIGNDADTKKMIQYNLTQIGKHSLFKWILAYFFATNRIGINFHGGQYSLLKYAFSPSECLEETNASRLTVAGYIYESIGDINTARRLFMRALRYGRYVNEETYNVILGSAIRANDRCRQNFEFMEQLDSNFSPEATSSLYTLSSHHVSLLDGNRSILFETLVAMKNLFNLCSNSRDVYAAIPLLCKLCDINLSRYVDVKLPFIVECLVKNVLLLLKRQRKDFRLLFSSLDHSGRVLLVKQIQKFVALCNFERYDIDTKCLLPRSGLSPFIGKAIGKITVSTAEKDCSAYSMIALGLPRNKTAKCSDESGRVEVGSPSSQVKTVANELLDVSRPCPYSSVMNSLRNSIFPLPLTDEERLMVKRSRLMNLQKVKVEEQDRRHLETSEASYLNMKERHGCHSGCNMVLSLLRSSIFARDFDASLKYAHLCLDIRCISCLKTSKILPLVSYVTVETRNNKLIQKALHLYPYDCLLRKTMLLLLTAFNV